MSTGTPVAEVELGPELVHRLLAAQHPDLAALPLARAASGWDNETYRLGEGLAVRLPRRAAAAVLIEHEQRWLPRLASTLPLAVPAPVRVGVPGCGYPWRWSVVPWYAGASADVAPVAGDQAAVLGRFLRALHVTAPPQEAPHNPFRGVELRGPVADRMEERLQRLSRADRHDVRSALTAWERGLAAPRSAAPSWLHGDLHPRNVLVSDGRLAAVIDWGDVTAGDPATDLASAWLLFDLPDHQAFRDAYGPAPAGTWERAGAWAAYFAVVLLEVGLADDSAFLTVAQRALGRLAG